MGLLDSVKDFAKPLLNLGSGLFNAYNQDNTRGNYYDILRQREDKNFADTQAYNEAYGKWQEQANAARAANSASAAANARASAAAASATEKNRQKALKKALGSEKETNAAQQAMYDPYVQTGLRLLPQMENTYSKGMQNSNMLSAYLNTPGQLQKLNQAALPSQTGIKLPSYLRGA